MIMITVVVLILLSDESDGVTTTGSSVVSSDVISPAIGSSVLSADVVSAVTTDVVFRGTQSKAEKLPLHHKPEPLAGVRKIQPCKHGM